MKVCLFNTENGLYQGEIFMEADKLEEEVGITPLHPPVYGSGQVPVFDFEKKEWVVIPMTVARQLLNIRPPRSRENLV